MNNELLKYFKVTQKKVNEALISEEEINRLDLVPLLNTQCLYVYDFARNKIIYARNANLLGFNDDELSLEYVSNYHKDDMELVNTVTTAAIKHGIEDNMLDHNCCLELTFRLKTKKGNYIHVLKQTTIYHLDNKKRMSTNTTILNDISFIKTPNYVNWSFKLKNLDHEYFEAKICGDVKQLFSSKELELIPLFIKGLTSKKIAELTCGSQYTIDTHRRNIKKKSGCKNMYDLLRFCNRNRLI